MTTAMLTDDDRSKIAALLATMHLPQGLGTREEACSIAADAADAADAAEAAYAARAARAADAADAADAAERQRAWADFDPCGLLEQLIAVGAEPTVSGATKDNEA